MVVETEGCECPFHEPRDNLQISLLISVRLKGTNQVVKCCSVCFTNLKWREGLFNEIYSYGHHKDFHDHLVELELKEMGKDRNSSFFAHGICYGGGSYPGLATCVKINNILKTLVEEFKNCKCKLFRPTKLKILS